MIQLVTLVTNFDVIISQQLVCLCGYLIGSWYFYKVFSVRMGEYESLSLMFIWSIMPFSIYFINGYSETILFALVGVFFYQLGKGNIIFAGIVLSYCLITRPHGLALLPVFFYYIFQLEYGIKDTTWSQALYRTVFSFIEHMPIIIFFPAILTCYWFINYGDSLVYKNILYAWGTLPQTLGEKIVEVFFVIKDTFRGVGFTPTKVYNLTFVTLSPHQLASFVLIINILLIPVFCKRKFFDFFLFNVSVAGFWLFSGDVANAGRHLCMMFSIPFSLILVVTYLIENSNKIKIVGIYNFNFRYILALLSFFLFVIFFSISIIHYFWFSIRYFNGVWVS